MAEKYDECDGRDHVEHVIEALRRDFGRHIDFEIIESVAYECGYDVEKSREKLAEIAHVQPSSSSHRESPYPSPCSSAATFASQIKIDRPRTQPQPSPPPSQRPSWPAAHHAAIEDTRAGHLTLIVMRGLPGSGKSTLAQGIIQATLGPSCNPRKHIFTTDDYFRQHGSYRFNPAFLGEAHDWNQRRVYTTMQLARAPIIIDNTNVELWEMKCYACWAVEHGYRIHVLEPTTPWKYNVGELSRRNAHGVPFDTIKNMRERFQHGITGESLLKEFNLRYAPDKQPPLMRKQPPVVVPEPVKQCDVSIGTCYDEKIGKIVCSTGGFVNNGVLPPNYPRAGHFDKGTNTEDDEQTERDDLQTTLDYLQSIFAVVPRDCLKDVIEKCKGDVEWAIDLLLEDKKEVLVNYQPPAVEAEALPEVEVDMDIHLQETIVEEHEGTRSVEDVESLRQYIESNIVINPKHYSDHVLRLKGMLPGPSQTKENDNDANVIDDFEFEDDDDEIIDITDDDDDDVAMPKDMVELTIGNEMAQQLNRLFGVPDNDLVGIQPVVEVPRALAQQLHALYLESVYKQVEQQLAAVHTMLQEDADFALTLQMEELARLDAEEKAQDQEEAAAPNLKQIMVDQAGAQRNQRQADNQWRNLTPDTLAQRMTIQKLATGFPKLDRDLLEEFLHAHENNYQETVDSLLASGAEHVPNTRRTISANTLEEMRAAHSACGGAVDLPAMGEQTSDALRQKAVDHQKRRFELLEKAKAYHQRGMTEVAVFYSELASRQTQMCEQTNNMAAVRIMAENMQRANSADTIDLHYLRVPEALNAMDIFLDEMIHKLQGGGGGDASFVYVITGRGKNSPGGIPRIRPSVQRRLAQRRLKYQLVNAGLLKVKVTRNAVMSIHVE